MAGAGFRESVKFDAFADALVHKRGAGGSERVGVARLLGLTRAAAERFARPLALLEGGARDRLEGRREAVEPIDPGDRAFAAASARDRVRPWSWTSSGSESSSHTATMRVQASARPCSLIAPATPSLSMPAASSMKRIELTTDWFIASAATGSRRSQAVISRKPSR